MTIAESRPPVTPGEPAPDFTLAAVDRKETVSLADVLRLRQAMNGASLAWRPYLSTSGGRFRLRAAQHVIGALHIVRMASTFLTQIP